MTGTAWALRKPDGALVVQTVAATKGDCWAKAFPVVCYYVRGFELRWWKNWNGSIRAASRRGYRMVRVKLVVADSLAKPRWEP